MSQSELVEVIASVVRRTKRGASDVSVARAIVTGLSAAGYEIVRTRRAPAADARPEAPRPVDHPTRRAG
jgi:hypothetical protein